MDPKKLLERLPRLDRDRPFRYLGRRVVQAMAEAATANLLLGQRTAPGRYLVVRLVNGAAEREEWEQQFAESRAVLLKEIEREGRVRDITLRSALELELAVVTDGEAPAALDAALDPGEVPAVLARLREEREVILPRRVRTLVLESDPSEAQAYLDHKPLGVTPCRVDELPEGEHLVTLSKPGYLLHEETIRVEGGKPGQKRTYRMVLKPEPPMGVLEVVTFPPGARVTVRGETREAPARWRVPAEPAEVRVELPEFEPQTVAVTVPRTTDERPFRLPLRLRYIGPNADEVVGRLIVYKPGSGDRRRPVPAQAPAGNTISAFFRDADPEERVSDWDLPGIQAARDEEPVVLAELPLRRGVLLIGREDPGGALQPDLRLFDPENSVSRGCHAWLWVYADTSTGATYNTFLIGNNSPAGLRVDGALVMETRRLSEDSEIEIGSFRMRVVKETPEPRVEFSL